MAVCIEEALKRTARLDILTLMRIAAWNIQDGEIPLENLQELSEQAKLLYEKTRGYRSRHAD